MSEKQVSASVIRRLPRYYRFLGMLAENGVHRISSGELSSKMGLTASQIRQDLNCFGGFGQQGYGYNVEALWEEIGKILGLGLPKKTILVGAGNLGRAILTHMEFAEKGFSIVGIFDRDERFTGEVLEGIPIRHTDALEEFCQKEKPSVAICAYPKWHPGIWSGAWSIWESKGFGISAIMILACIILMWRWKMSIWAIV